MKTLRDFQCNDCGSVFEAYAGHDTHVLECRDCHGKARRLIGTPRIKLEGVTGAFPTAHDRWAKIREDNARIKARRQ